jgi:hypothetical protein
MDELNTVTISWVKLNDLTEVIIGFILGQHLL